MPYICNNVSVCVCVCVCVCFGLYFLALHRRDI